jgi:hypothetical protein
LITNAGVSLHQTRYAAGVRRHRIVEGQRLQDAVPHRVVVAAAGQSLDDHPEDDVVGIGVLPPLARRERRLRIEQVGNLLLGAPHAVGVGQEVDEELFIELVADNSAGVVHELPHSDVGMVG